MKIKNLLGSIMLVVIVLYLLYLPNPLTIAPGSSVLSDISAGDSVARVAGNSMEPAISHGDMVTVKVVSFDTLKVNDIILVQNPGGSTSIKRIVNIDSDGSLQIKSDNRSNIEKITERNYIGKMVKMSHKDGNIRTLP